MPRLTRVDLKNDRYDLEYRKHPPELWEARVPKYLNEIETLMVELDEVRTELNNTCNALSDIFDQLSEMKLAKDLAERRMKNVEIYAYEELLETKKELNRVKAQRNTLFVAGKICCHRLAIMEPEDVGVKTWNEACVNVKKRDTL